jgi:hypothetical protein
MSKDRVTLPINLSSEQLARLKVVSNGSPASSWARSKLLQIIDDAATGKAEQEPELPDVDENGLLVEPPEEAAQATADLGREVRELRQLVEESQLWLQVIFAELLAQGQWKTEEAERSAALKANTKLNEMRRLIQIALKEKTS